MAAKSDVALTTRELTRRSGVVIHGVRADVYGKIPFFFSSLFSLSSLLAFDVETHVSRSSNSCFMPSYGGDVRVSFASRRKKPSSLMSVANSNSLIFKGTNVRDPRLI